MSFFKERFWLGNRYGLKNVSKFWQSNNLEKVNSSLFGLLADGHLLCLLNLSTASLLIFPLIQLLLLYLLCLVY